MRGTWEDEAEADSEMRHGDWLEGQAIDRPQAKAARINGDTADPFPHWADTKLTVRVAFIVGSPL